MPCPPMMVTRMASTLHTARLARVQTSTHNLTIGEREVRKEFVADHEAQAEREWACLTLLAEHAPGLAPRPLRREDDVPVGAVTDTGTGPRRYDARALPAVLVVRWLATQPAGHHRGAGRAFHGSRGPALDLSVGAGPVARPRTP